MNIIWLYRVDADIKGHITTWRETHRYLSEQHDIHYIFPYSKEKLSFSENTVFVETIRLPYLRRLSLIVNSFVRFCSLSKKVQPDIVIVDIWSFFFSLLYAFRKDRPKFMLDIRTSEFNMQSNQDSLKAMLLRKYSALAVRFNAKHHDGITFISDVMREQFEALPGARIHANYAIWPSGVNTELFNPGVAGDARAPRETYTLFFHGSLTPNRGLAEAVRALALLRAEGVSVRFKVVGGGAYLDRLQVLAAELKLEDAVEFAGYADYARIPALIADADLCILTYPKLGYWEANVPLKILEYMAMRKPVLCTRLRVFEDMTEAGPFAVFIDDNSPWHIADGINYAMNNQTVLAAHGEQAREIVQRRYTWEAISRHLDEFLNRTAQR